MRYILTFLQMYGLWEGQPLWPLPAAPSGPFSGGGYRVIAELSGTWKGGTVPGIYTQSEWQLSREIAIPESAWLYLPVLAGEVALYLNDRLWSVGEKQAVVPLYGPGKLRVSLRGSGPGGILGGAYLIARNGPMAWPLDTAHTWSERLLPGNPLPAPEGFYGRPERASRPPWLWAVGMALWGLAAFLSYPVRQAHWRGPWTTTPPHPLENVLGFVLVAVLLFLVGSFKPFLILLGIGLALEIGAFYWMRVPIEKLWQSWLPVVLVSLIFLFQVRHEVLLWGAWAARNGLMVLYMPGLAYLCLGNLFLYLLLFA